MVSRDIEIEHWPRKKLEGHFVGNKAKGRTCAYQGVRNVPFSENLACFVFLKHPF